MKQIVTRLEGNWWWGTRFVTGGKQSLYPWSIHPDIFACNDYLHNLLDI